MPLNRTVIEPRATSEWFTFAAILFHILTSQTIQQFLKTWSMFFLNTTGAQILEAIFQIQPNLVQTTIIDTDNFIEKPMQVKQLTTRTVTEEDEQSYM